MDKEVGIKYRKDREPRNTRPEVIPRFIIIKFSLDEHKETSIRLLAELSGETLKPEENEVTYSRSSKLKKTSKTVAYYNISSKLSFEFQYDIPKANRN